MQHAPYNYEQIKQLAKDSGRKVTDYIALAAQNDPFYVGTPNDIALAEWFTNLYYRLGYHHSGKVHIRRCHYAILSLGVPFPNGKPYENTEEAWNMLLQASKAARYLKLVDVAAFDDKRNDDPVTYSQDTESEPEIRINDYLYYSDLELPDFPNPPSYRLDSYQAMQRYHLEIWCEKTTMNDVLFPLCQRYGMTLQTGAGELSITSTRLLAERLAASGKPARIFYVSDFDPAGQSMPVAVSRKLEYFERTDHLDLDVRLYPLVLSADQVRRYALPRTPIKESERRKDSFEAQHGTGAVELDALEALHSGELRRILTAYIEHYYDTYLTERTEQARYVLNQDLDRVRREVLARHSEELDALRAELVGIRADLGPRMEHYSQGLRDLWQAISVDLHTEVPDLDEYPLPEAKEADELGDGLYNSQRDYLAQIDAYKQFQGKMEVQA